MQEFDFKRTATNQKNNASNFDDIPVNSPSQTLNQSINSTSTTPFVQISKKPQGPFPYLKRKSIRIDLVLKKQKQQAKKKQSAKHAEILRREKKILQEENLILKGRILQMEKLFADLNVKSQMKVKTAKHQGSQTSQCKSQGSSCQKSAKNSLVECPNCYKCHKSKYMKYHQRICGNTQLKRLLSAKDLKRLEFIRMNQQTVQPSPVNNWRKTRQQFLSQINKDKLRTPSISCLAAYKRNFRK